MPEYRLISWRVPELAAQIAKLSKYAARLGVPAPTLTEVRRETGRREVRGFEVALEFVVVEVCGAAPKIAGWRFLGTLAHGAEPSAANIFRAVPGEQMPESYRFRAQHCDHCRQTRTRTATYLVAADDGRIQQVGKNCLRDFLGHDNPEAIAGWLEALGDVTPLLGDDEDGAFGDYGGGGWRRVGLPTEALLAQTAAVTAAFGWVPRSRAEDGDLCTADRVQEALPVVIGLAKPTFDRRGRDLAIYPTDAHIEEGKAARAWILAQPEAWRAGSDYRANLYYAAQRDLQSEKEVGLICSLLPVYRRETEREREQKAAQSAAPKAHIGTLGERCRFTLTVLGVTDCESNYGVTMIHKMADPAGNPVTWFATSGRLMVGETYVIAATVKAHQEYKGVPQTVITRAKVEKMVGGEKLEARYLALETEYQAAQAAAAQADSAVRAALETIWALQSRCEDATGHRDQDSVKAYTDANCPEEAACAARTYLQAKEVAQNAGGLNGAICKIRIEMDDILSRLKYTPVAPGRKKQAG